MRKYLILIPFLFIILPGCSVWENFTTYFNLYYNTSDLFDQAEQTLAEQQKDPFVRYDTPLPGSVSQTLDKVIEKCSKILQFNSNSAFVDDALLMIGKAFYYQKNFIKALRKFQELIATKPESDLVLEARLWEAKTQFAMNNSEKALALLDEVKKTALQEDDTRILKSVYLEEIRFFLIHDEFEKALPLCTDFVNFNSDDELNARVYFQAAEIFAGQKNYTMAKKYYIDVYSEFSPTYELGFRARLQEGKMELYTDNHDIALKIFQKLRSDIKYKEFYDQVDLAIGITYIRMERFDDAQKLLHKFDTTYTSSMHLGNARYVLAQMYEKDMKNYDSANTFYQKAMSSASTVEYLPLIKERAQTFTKYTALSIEYLTNKKQYIYGIHPEKFIEDSTKYAADTAAQKNEAPVENAAKTVVTSSFQERRRDFEDDADLLPPDGPSDMGPGQGRTPPPIPRMRENFGGGAIPPNQGQTPGQPARTLAAGPKRPTIPVDSLRALVAKSSLDLGNLFLISLGNLDSAGHYYKEIMIDYDSTSLRGRTLLALASYYSTLNDTLTADSLYNYIYDNFKNERIVNEAAKKINKPDIDFEYDAGKDLYLEAEKKFNAGKHSEAYTDFQNVFLKHPSSKFAGKALYASGYILENHLNLRDSAAIVYDTLSVKFPNSAYTQKITPRLSFYKEEQRRIKQLIADSLQKIKDSLRTDSLKLAAADSIKNAEKNPPKTKIADSTGQTSADTLAKHNFKMMIQSRKQQNQNQNQGEETETPPEEKSKNDSDSLKTQPPGPTDNTKPVEQQSSPSSGKIDNNPPPEKQGVTDGKERLDEGTPSEPQPKQSEPLQDDKSGEGAKTTAPPK